MLVGGLAGPHESGRGPVRGCYLDGGPAVLRSESPAAQENQTMKKPSCELRISLIATLLMASGIKRHGEPVIRL